MGAINLLSDRRSMRAMEGTVTQRQMFALAGRFNPEVESIAKVKDVDDALNTSRIYSAVMGDEWVRTDQYGVFHRDPKARLGSEILYVENGIRYKHLVPDVPVTQSGKEISLQKAVGLGVYDSIGLLKLEQTDRNIFTVSVVDPAALTGKVRVVDFMRNGWALTDEHGFPLASQPVSSDNAAARCGGIARFTKKSTGWHGSVGRGVGDFSYLDGRYVVALDFWSVASGVAIVGRPKVPSTSGAVEQGSPNEATAPRD